MRFAQFHHKGLRQLHEGNPKGVPPTMADKLRKLLFALENADDLLAGQSVSGLEASPAQRRPEGILESYCHRQLALDLPLSRRDEYCQQY